MRLFGLLLIFAVTIDTTLKAQSSIGFSEPDSIRAILDYRLPDWGFATIYWDFSLNASLSNVDENRFIIYSRSAASFLKSSLSLAFSF